MKGPFLRTAYNYDMNKVSDETGLDCSVEPSMTQQSFRDECDINTLVMRFGLGQPLPTGLAAPTYGDFTGVDDYQSALNAIMVADDAFMQMPANIRSRFENSAAKFVEFCSSDDPAVRLEAEKLGLVLPKIASLVKQDGGVAPVEAKPGA